MAQRLSQPPALPAPPIDHSVLHDNSIVYIFFIVYAWHLKWTIEIVVSVYFIVLVKVLGDLYHSKSHI